MSRAVDYVLTWEDCYGSLAIDNLELNCPGWCIPDLSALWATPDVRGSDRLLPGVPGVKAYRRRSTVTRYSLPFLVTGQVDLNGVVYEDPEAGLETNVAYLMDAVLLPTDTGDGTRVAVWTLPSGATVTADVHVFGLAGPTLLPKALMRATLELSVPHGDLHL